MFARALHDICVFSVPHLGELILSNKVVPPKFTEDVSTNCCIIEKAVDEIIRTHDFGDSLSITKVPLTKPDSMRYKYGKNELFLLTHDSVSMNKCGDLAAFHVKGEHSAYVFNNIKEIWLKR